MKLEPDSWLKSIFGHDVFRITDIETGSLPSDIMSVPLSEKRQVFLYAKVPVTQVGTVHLLTRAGFNVVDVNVTFECLPRKNENHPPPLRATIRDAMPEECEMTQSIAGTCFIHSRFHRDPNIHNNLANLIKREWVANYFKGERGERILVAERDSKPVGFLAITKMTVQDTSIGIIDLIGIAPEYQGMGIGRQLVDFFITDSFGKFDLLRVGTQIANLPSMNLYQRCGFHITDATYICHAHFRDGRVLL